MKKAERKIAEVGGISLYTVPNEDLASLARAIRNSTSGIFLVNENSMIDTYRLDSLDNGLTGSQAVDLEARTGSEDVLDLIELMKSRQDVTFFPGTLLRDFGGYVLPTMPIVQNGKLVCEKIKQTGIAYIDDYDVLRKKWVDKSSCEIEQLINQEIAIKRQNNFASVSVNGLNVLPIICNELSLAPELYNGKPVDIILHSCEALYCGVQQRIAAYEKVIMQMKAKNQISDCVVLAAVEEGENLFKGIFSYENNRLEFLN